MLSVSIIPRNSNPSGYQWETNEQYKRRETAELWTEAQKQNVQNATVHRQPSLGQSCPWAVLGPSWSLGSGWGVGRSHICPSSPFLFSVLVIEPAGLLVLGKHFIA